MKPSIADQTALDVVWETCDRPGWDSLVSQAGRSSLEQSWAYGEAVAATASGPELDWLMRRYVSFRRERRFLGPDPDLIQAFATSVGGRGDVLVMRALADGVPVAGLLLLRHGASAMYYVGWTSDEGRRCRAHNLLLWRGMLALRAAGVAWLDLGGINTASAPGVARFKLGFGGEVFTLAGTYI